MTRTRVTWALFAAVPFVLLAAVFLSRALSPSAPVQASTGETPLSAIRASDARLASLPDTPALPTPKPKKRTSSPASASVGAASAGIGAGTSSTGASGGSSSAGNTYVPPAGSGSSGGSAAGSSGGSKPSGGSKSSGGSSGGCSGEACDFLP